MSEQRLTRVVGGVIFLTVVSGALGIRQAFAEHQPTHREWRGSDELIQQGELHTPGPILEVTLRYDVNEDPSVSLKRLVIKRGYAPQYAPLPAGYVLSLHAASGAALLSVTFEIPNVVLDPPPDAGAAGGEGPRVLSTVEFALTVPLPEDAVELRIVDPQGVLILQTSLENTPVKENSPNFRSHRHRRSSSEAAPDSPTHPTGSRLSWFLDVLMETAEAATTDGTALDVTFIGDNYTAADVVEYQQDVDRVTNHLMTYEPFLARASDLLFHRVDNTTIDLGCVHDTQIPRLIICNPATVISTVNDAGAPYDKIIVLVKDSVSGGATFSGLAVSSNDAGAPPRVTHEFGHSFGDLADEYTAYSYTRDLDGTTWDNCYAGPPPNPNWQGLVPATDYRLGCTYMNWYRSSPCSIMLDLGCRYFNAISRLRLNDVLDAYVSLPAVFLRAQPGLLKVGSSTNLSWSSSNVSTCEASGGWSGTKLTAGQEPVTPLVTSTYSVTCAGALGAETKSTIVTVDSLAPSVAITSPGDGAIVGGAVTIRASASDDYGVRAVYFYEDGGLVGVASTVPYEWSWNTVLDTEGSHTLTAQAQDLVYNDGFSLPVSVTVDNTAPAVSLTEPAAGSTVSGTAVTVTASASDNIGVQRVEFYRDANVLLDTDTSAPYSITWDSTLVANGSHTLFAKAVDLAGNVTTSASQTVTVEGGDSTAPTVSITSPANGSTVPRNKWVTITASASDNVGVSRVEFYVSGTLICTDASSPYACAWRVPGAKNRTYTLQAKAYDAVGNVGSSGLVTVTAR